ncbi:MAG: undecaprenyldiphospho-muramoylpentapeptide beta-N-acetylglucosaminyltransferase, partial [Proteobacteria bacterium]|nr:undecaprenyldiphospho-muramoylpentapeptide beta-N-acetylglucosaminyltransferase [Pseudomonadota bacterium]
MASAEQKQGGLKVVMAGGGTGGHLFPGLAVARELERLAGAEVMFIGSGRPLEVDVLSRAGYPLETIRVAGLMGRGPLAKLAVLIRLPGAVIEAGRILKNFGADLAMGLGGYSAGPVGLAAGRRQVPLVLLEQNVMPGRTTRWLCRRAARVFTSFPGTARILGEAKCVLTGNPVRREVAAAAGAPRPADGRFHLLVFGGSQGARAINQAMVQAAAALAGAADRLSVIHQTGPGQTAEVEAAYRGAGLQAEVHEFIHDMAAAYARTDLTVCRAGATTLAELSAAGVPAILIPYPFAAAGHQEQNARALAEAGAAEMILQA